MKKKTGEIPEDLRVTDLIFVHSVRRHGSGGSGVYAPVFGKERKTAAASAAVFYIKKEEKK